jgi:hypothetical protein
VLRESAWKGLGSEDDETAALGLGKRKRALGDSGEGSERVKRYTLAQLQSIIQASDAELVAAVREANAIEVDGHMLLLPPEPLRELLSLLLPLIALHSGAIESLPEGHTDPECEAADILCGLSSFVEPHLATAVMRHFGVVNASDMWAADVRRMVGELGRGLLVELKVS